MKVKVVCALCDAKSVEYTFSFNKGLAAFLWALYIANGPVKTDTLGLTYSQRTNSQKLRYWKLAVSVVNEESKKKAGWWEITDLGRDFVEGRRTIFRKVVMCRNKFVRYEGSPLSFKEITDGYLYRSDYQDQVKSQIKHSFDNNGQGELL